MSVGEVDENEREKCGAGEDTHTHTKGGGRGGGGGGVGSIHRKSARERDGGGSYRRILYSGRAVLLGTLYRGALAGRGELATRTDCLHKADHGQTTQFNSMFHSSI